jgi:hypothetical protein
LTNPQDTDITTIIQRRPQHPRRTGRDRSEQVVAIVGMRTLFVRMICERIAPGSERRKSQPKFFKPYRGVYRLTRREKKSLNGSDIYVAEGVSAYRH